jgi:hypothetical protein
LEEKMPKYTVVLYVRKDEQSDWIKLEILSHTDDREARADYMNEKGWFVDRDRMGLIWNR